MRKPATLMKFIKYFFYLAFNWNIRIAWHIIRKEIKGEKYYGIDTTGADELQSLEEKRIDISHATIYMPASYDILEFFFDKINLSSVNHFLDIGCGKGRAMCVATRLGAKKISGIELSKDLYLSAKENLEKTKLTTPNLQYKLYNNDAFYFEIERDVDCIFMFNPFDETVMAAVFANIKASLRKSPRKITIIYINPVQKQVLCDFGFKETFHFKKLHYLEGSIFEN